MTSLAIHRRRMALALIGVRIEAIAFGFVILASLAAMLIEMPDGFPVALGVIYEDPAPTFESAVVEQNAAAASGKTPDLQALVSKGQTWQVEKEPHKL